METVLEPISLGQACDVKFQIQRHLYFRAHPHGSLDVLRDAIESRRASPFFTRNLLDHQITPTRALITYLESDFQGVFERDDLFVNASGEVEHRALGVRMPHDFKSAEGVVSEATLEAMYPSVREAFERRADRFRQRLKRPGDFLYLRGDSPTPWEAERLLSLLSAGSSEHRFKIAFFDRERAAFDLMGTDERIVAQGVTPEAAHKPASRQWEGDDAAWDRLLSPFPLGMPGRPRFSPNFNLIEERPLGAEAVGLEWRSGESGQPVDAASIDVPAIPYGWAALSDRVDELAAAGSRTLLVTVEAKEGRAGVGLVRPDGSAVVGAIHPFAVLDGEIGFRFPLDPGMGPAAVVVRNNGSDEGAAVTVRDVALLPRHM